MLGIDVDGDDEALDSLDVVAIVGIEDQHPVRLTEPIFAGGKAIHSLKGFKTVCIKLAMQVGFQRVSADDDWLAGHKPDGPTLIEEHLFQPQIIAKGLVAEQQTSQVFQWRRLTINGQSCHPWIGFAEPVCVRELENTRFLRRDDDRVLVATYPITRVKQPTIGFLT